MCVVLVQEGEGGVKDYNINKLMQKTKLISKDFIRDCRIGRERERRENTIYNLPLPHQHEDLLLPIPDCHSIFTPEDNYSIDDFIHNLQADHFVYYNDPIDEFEDPRPQSRPIDQINQLYLQRITGQSLTAAPCEHKHATSRVRFGGELRAKYFREEDAAQVVGESQEFLYVMEEEAEELWEA